MISTIIAHEHLLLREGIKSVLQDEIDISLTNQAKDGRQLLRILEENLSDLLILDMDMPGESGIASLKKMLGLYPPLSILILSIHLTKRFAVRALTRIIHQPRREKFSHRDRSCGQGGVQMEAERYLRTLSKSFSASAAGIPLVNAVHPEQSGQPSTCTQI